MTTLRGSEGKHGTSPNRGRQDHSVSNPDSSVISLSEVLDLCMSWHVSLVCQPEDQSSASYLSENNQQECERSRSTTAFKNLPGMKRDAGLNLLWTHSSTPAFSSHLRSLSFCRTLQLYAQILQLPQKSVKEKSWSCSSMQKKQLTDGEIASEHFLQFFSKCLFINQIRSLLTLLKN